MGRSALLRGFLGFPIKNKMSDIIKKNEKEKE